jgi:hypothetical protein
MNDTTRIVAIYPQAPEDQFVCSNPKKANSQAGNDAKDNNIDAIISKALMGVFMRATQGESAITDLILAAKDKCSSTDSEEKQLSALCAFLGLQYDAGKAEEMDGTPCFSGPEGVCRPVQCTKLG